jgi:hypothetical protein
MADSVPIIAAMADWHGPEMMNIKTANKSPTGLRNMRTFFISDLLR